MGKTFDVVDEKMAQWLCAQPVFFVSTSPLSLEGSVNCSPKGNRDEFVVLGTSSVAFLDQTGSGVENIAHLRENGRIVLMFCAFEGPPRIVRLHGKGRVVPIKSPEFVTLAESFPGATGVGVRSIIVIDVTRISDSCGYGSAGYGVSGTSPSTMDQWSKRKGVDGHTRVLVREESDEHR